MTNLAHSALLFETSAKFQNASGALDRLARGEQLTDSNRNTLSWAANFLSGLDNRQPNGFTGSSNNLAVQSTHAKPSIYASLIQIRKNFVELGLDSQESISGFFAALHRLMQSGGTAIDVPFSENPDFLKLASMLYHGASLDLMNQLDMGDLPERPVLQGI